MTDDVRHAYDAVVEPYVALNRDALDRVPTDRDCLASFAQLAADSDHPIADLGCGPGHVVNHLSELGLTVVGYDISLGMLAEARRAFPHLQFEVGDLEALDIDDTSLGGIVARYSLIHVPPDRLAGIFGEWLRVLEPGAPVLVAFFAASAAEAHGSSFDHLVATAYELFPATIVTQLQDAGFTIVEIVMRNPRRGERPLEHGTVVATKAGL